MIQKVSNILLTKYHNKFACVILEPSGLIDADKSFLKSIRELCNKHKVILIFDEVISGFRIDLGGAQKKYNVIPDLSCFGKGMANGYPISAIVGKRKIMKMMERNIFSTTFGGETLSITAAITTIKKLKRLNIVEKNINYGKTLSSRLNKIISSTKLKNNLEISKVYWWPRIILKDITIDEDLAVSLLRQEFIEQGLFLGSTFNICYAHTKNNILKATTDSFQKVY